MIRWLSCASRLAAGASAALIAAGCMARFGGPPVGIDAETLFASDAERVPYPTDSMILDSWATDTGPAEPTRDPIVNARLKCGTPVFGLVRGVLEAWYHKPGQLDPVPIDLAGAFVRLGRWFDGVKDRWVTEAMTGSLGDFAFVFSRDEWARVGGVAISVWDERLKQNPLEIYVNAPPQVLLDTCVRKKVEVLPPAAEH